MKKLQEAISAPEFIPIQFDYQYQDWTPLFTQNVSYQQPEHEDLLEKNSTESENTVGYKRYIATVPKHGRRFPHPETPDKYSKCSKRAWDGLVRSWRRKLHLWDPPDKEVDYHSGSNR
ncbi:Oocyte-specific histone RNA stem-loop-binding protein 2 [Terramyces sp. JEL0728]|nr:Oocyte-specific histone RNA stem-loop-binding protein 2 [Terramyces sp. JEL0728]